MPKKLKKGKRGEVTLYITRTKAIKKLQLNLKDFRRLCILKGVYPREPNRKFEGNDKTYYAKKDINYLMHDRIVRKLQDIKTAMKKYKRAKKMGEAAKADGFLKRKPKLDLTHIVKERYPTFIDAIRDLDDPLCLINLFASLPSHRQFKIPPERLQLYQKLQREFNFWVIKGRALRKVFLSIKGIYFQAEIEGQKVLWLQPYQFSQTQPYDVDYRVMTTFQDFYETMMKFVLFKLYSNVSIEYPPVADKEIVDNQDFSFNAMIEKSIEKDAEEELEQNKYKIDNEFQEDENVKRIFNKGQNSSDLFENFVFFLSTEVSRTAFEFIIMSFGGKVISDLDNFESEAYNNSSITHVVTDRPPQSLTLDSRREFIQPQWICDSVNNQILLPLKDYTPGKALPPHLSPFDGDAGKEGAYVPDREKELKKLKGEEIDGEEESDDESDIGEEVVAPADDYLESEEEYDAGREMKSKKLAEKKKVVENKEMAEKMLTKRKRRILEKIKFGKNKKEDLASKLKERKKALAKGKKN